MKKRTEIVYEYDAIFEPNGGGYTVTVPRLPGLVTEGITLAEARAMARDAIRCALEAALKERTVSRSVRKTHRERVVVGR